MSDDALLSSLPGADERQGYEHEVRPMRAVRTIHVKGSVELYFRRSDEQHLVVAGETQQALAEIKTTFSGDTLFVEREGISVTINSSFGSISIGSLMGGIFVDGKRVDAGRNHGRAVICVSLPAIHAVRIKGSADVTLLDLDQTELQVEVMGSGDVTADGQVEFLEAVVSGSGDIDARNLVAQRGFLSVMGSGDITAHVSQDAIASVEGSGDIVVRGNPAQRSKSVQGSGSVKFKD